MIVRTVLGDIDPGELGVTYSHEHLIIDSPTVEREWPHIHLPSAAEAIAELEKCRSVGVATVVDAMPTGSGRDMRRLVEISRAAGVRVVASTGMHTPKYYKGVSWADDPGDRLAARFVEEILVGAEGTGARTGVMKTASTGELLKARERSLFEAAAQVHEATGVPLLTHCELGIGGMSQIEALRDFGVPLGRVILSHTDKVADVGYHRDLLGSGANLVYDQALREADRSVSPTATLIHEMWVEGYGRQLLLGTDGARRSLWSILGGEPGLAWLRTGFTDVLRRLGLVAEQISAMFVTNPARVLSFDPPR